MCGAGLEDQPLTRDQVEHLLWRLRYKTLRGQRVLFGETVVELKTQRGRGQNDSDNNCSTPRRAILHGLGGVGYASVEWLPVRESDQQWKETRDGAQPNTTFVPYSNLVLAPEKAQHETLSKALAGSHQGITKAEFSACCTRWPNRTASWFRKLQLSLQDLPRQNERTT